MGILEEVARRRTFAIISHPDAGKTTLTEKFLLYGGAVQLAGAVKARRNQRATTSDWMEMEKKRGISISSTVLQFEYEGIQINLLDTPGHADFSEDTYRVLTAVDAVVMVIDAAKGIEAQTLKLFEVCRRRGIPIFTFVNKMDRPTLDPLELLDQLESVLKIGAYPMNWPLGTGFEFQGLFDRQKREVHLFELVSGGAYRAPVQVSGLHDEIVMDKLSGTSHHKMLEELGMLDVAGESLDINAILDGKQTPVFFGSARNNFGVQLLLDGFLQYAGPPRPRMSKGKPVPLDKEGFSGFIFKIQANMDPRHRDRLAFLRVCSGKFTRDMMVFHPRTGKKVRLANSQKMFGRDRETVDDAFPGDIVGFVGQASFAIGDTLTEDPDILYNEIPHFPPECFAMLQNPNPANFKRFRDGLDQLLQEGAVQAFNPKQAGQRIPILAAVGPLQFEVVQYRLENEYGAPSRLEPAGWKILRWLHPDAQDDAASKLTMPTGSVLTENEEGQQAILFPGDWALNYFIDKNPGIALGDLPFENAKRNG